ncbi:MAG: YihY family inner membrane protein [Alistipes sp.]|nr:YihY family inner membrane protein [Alistipes sp.]
MKRLIKRIEHIVHYTLLRLDRGSSRGYNFFVRSYRLLYYTLRSRKLNRTFVDSAALTLQTMVAVIPLLAFTLVILREMDAWESSINSLYESFAEWRSLLEVVVETASVAADSIPSGVFAIVGLGSLLWMIFIVFRAVEGSFNHIWGVRNPRGFVKRYVSYTVVAVVVPVLWGLATTFSLDSLSFLGVSDVISEGLMGLFSVLISVVGAALLYKYLPHAEVRWRYAIMAASLVGVVLTLWQWGYVYLQVYMTNINTIYGSMAAVPLFIVWLQVSWNIILFGCELCYVWQNAKRYESIDSRRLGFQSRSPREAMRAVVVGSGNVAEAFARSLAECRGVDLVEVVARNEERGRSIAESVGAQWCGDASRAAVADIYIIAVSDRVVSEVARGLAVAEGGVVVHTAGSVAMDALEGFEGRRGIIYPLQSFTSGRRVSLESVPLFIEADGDVSRERVEELSSKLSVRVEYADSERRRVIHLAGVFVNNFVNHLYASGADIVSRVELDFDVLKPLIDETARKALESNDPRKVQTGPAVRGDRVVTERHREMLRDDEIKQQIYNYITESIWETSKKI